MTHNNQPPWGVTNTRDTPVPSKMLTGATVALIGDTLAQSRDNAIPYDR